LLKPCARGDVKRTVPGLCNPASVKMEKPMKSVLCSLVAAGLFMSAAAPAFAEAPPANTSKEDCQKKQGWEWDFSQGKCVEQAPGG